MGDVRLGELGGPDDDHRRHLSDLFPEGRRGGDAGAGGDQPVRVGDDDRDRDRRGDRRRSSARSRTMRRSRRGCSPCSWRSAPARARAMFFITRGDWQLALILFIVANVGVAGSIVFYDSLLPHIAAGRGARSRLHRRLRDRLSRRRRAARDQHPDDEQARVVLPAEPRGRRAREPGERRRVVGRVLDPAVPPRSRAGPPSGAGRAARRATR